MLNKPLRINQMKGLKQQKLYLNKAKGILLHDLQNCNKGQKHDFLPTMDTWDLCV